MFGVISVWTLNATKLGEGRQRVSIDGKETKSKEEARTPNTQERTPKGDKDKEACEAEQPTESATPEARGRQNSGIRREQLCHRLLMWVDKTEN